MKTIYENAKRAKIYCYCVAMVGTTLNIMSASKNIIGSGVSSVITTIGNLFGLIGTSAYSILKNMEVAHDIHIQITDADKIAQDLNGALLEVVAAEKEEITWKKLICSEEIEAKSLVTLYDSRYSLQNEAYRYVRIDFLVQASICVISGIVNFLPIRLSHNFRVAVYF